MPYSSKRLNTHGERTLKCWYTKDLPEGLAVRDVMTLDMLVFLQERLLEGDEGRFDQRSPMSVNSMMRAVMAFVRFCHKHGWIEQVPRVDHLNADEVMRGRAVTSDEFDRMLAATPLVVGNGASASWQFALRILWESGFRVGDLMDFAWDDSMRIHPVWPTSRDVHPTILIPSTQKNGKVQEIPLLRGLEQLLQTIPGPMRQKWIVTPEPMEYERRSD